MRRRTVIAPVPKQRLRARLVPLSLGRYVACAIPRADLHEVQSLGVTPSILLFNVLSRAQQRVREARSVEKELVGGLS